MVAKRIIPCLDIKNGRTVKGINFQNLVDAGNPIELAKQYANQSADELVFLDISATLEERKTTRNMVLKIAEQINIPFTVGGGIGSVEDVDVLLKHGADKISVNSSVLRDPNLINRLAHKFGSQCIVVAIDAKQIDEHWIVYAAGGTIPTKMELFKWAKEVALRGAGEILFTSMSHDGTKKGFANNALHRLSQEVNIPIIASGGAGTSQHFIDVFTQGKADAALAASVFHFNEIPLISLKETLKMNHIKVR